jgi:hypothetical protein
VTSTHDQILELAAAAIDFELSPLEQETLAGHLRECTTCPRRIAGLQADQRAIARLPRYSMSQARVDRVAQRVGRGGAAPASPLRLVAVAALLALLVLGALAVGAEVVRRQEDPNLSVVPPVPTTNVLLVTPSPTPTPPATATPSVPVPSPTPRPGTFPADTLVEIVVDGLRVRTAPTVDDATSAKLEPLLGNGTKLHILDGPVTADDYDWYLVQAIGWPHHGWVAAADHDGSPWIVATGLNTEPAPDKTDAEAALYGGLGKDVGYDCAPRRTDLPAGATAGIECDVNAATAIRVGIYGFPDAQAATSTYFDRLASYGVQPDSGACAAGTVGDEVWTDGEGRAVGRIGCFLDENGTANLRVVCGSTYVGVLGRGGDLKRMYPWAWMFGDPATDVGGEPPLICRGT